MIRAWAEHNLPQFMLTGTLAVWQMLLLPVVVIAAYSGARIAAALINPIVARLSKRTQINWDDMLVDGLRGPLRLLLTGALLRALFPLLELQGQAAELSLEGTRIILLLSGFWALLRSVDISHRALRSTPWLHARPATLPIFALLARVIKIIIVALAVVTSLQQLGYPVAGLIAGLGVGGLAVALAAQKTLEHLLGSVMLSIDQPLQVGALVKVGDVVGTVEQIGLRSTRIRSLARTLVTIPNGKLADSQIENLSLRDRLQFQVAVGLRYGTSAEQVRKILVDIKAHMQKHARFVKEETFAHLRDLGDSGMIIEVNAWLRLDGDDDPRDVRQDALLALLHIVEQNGSGLAFPTRTLHLHGTPEPHDKK